MLTRSSVLAQYIRDPKRGMRVARLMSASSPSSSVSDILSYLASGKTSPESNKVMKLQQSYAVMDDVKKNDFLLHLATSYSTNIQKAHKSFESNFSTVSNIEPSVSIKKIASFRASLTPPYETIFSNVARENGLTLLLRLRSDLLSLMASLKKQKGKQNPSDSTQEQDNCEELLAVMDMSLKQQLTSWFSVGFLQLERITYEGTGGGILEKIARYETVHKVRGLYDFKARLGPGRRCYALFHPCLPEEPLVFVHVALVPEIANSMNYIHQHSGFENPEIHHDAKEGFDSMEHDMRNLELTESREKHSSKAAIFYSINSTQPGLRGVELGNYLIKRVAQTLSRELPNINQFCTLSPIPGFMRWLKQTSAKSASSGDGKESVPSVSHLFSTMEKEVQLVNNLLERVLADDVVPGGESSLEAKLVNLVTKHPHVIKEAVNKADTQVSSLEEQQALEAIFSKLVVHYLVQVKKQGGSGEGSALDPVANFHLRNGAMLHRVNWGGDVSANGLQASGGLMANYLYELSRIEARSEQYELKGEFDLGSGVAAKLS